LILLIFYNSCWIFTVMRSQNCHKNWYCKTCENQETLLFIF